MKKIKVFAAILFFAFCAHSCAETRKFSHIYYFIETKNVDGVETPKLDNSGKAFYWNTIVIDNFSGGDDIGYLYDEGQKTPLSEKIKSFTLAESGKISESKYDTGNHRYSKTDYEIEGNKGDVFSFSAWQTPVSSKNKDGEIEYNFEDYRGTGCENMIFYATYSSPKQDPKPSIPDPINGPPYRHTYLTIPTKSNTSNSAIKTIGDENEFVWDEFYYIEDYRSGQKIGYYYKDGQEFPISDYKDNPELSIVGVKGFTIPGRVGDEEVVYTSQGVEVISGKPNDKFVFDKWCVLVNGKFVPYTSGGQNDLTFYATYKIER